MSTDSYGKRAFTALYTLYDYSPDDLTHSNEPHESHEPPLKRRSSANQHSIMSVQASLPSFMEVESDDSTFYQSTYLKDQPKLKEDSFPLISHTQHQLPYAHADSIKSTFSDSNESSPTTTSSTFDSPITSDNSASSSPESALPMSSTPFRFQAQPFQQTGVVEEKKNAKKLTLDMNLPAIRRPATSSGPLDGTHTFSAPTSPLKEPLKTGRKLKSNNLTILTPSYQQSFPRTGAIPATPGQRLQHMQSSPALATLASPRGPPAGGMFLPLPSLNTQYAGSSSSSNGSSFMANSMPDLREENEMPKSQEAPEKGYTEGPVCVYDCGVYLFLEPTAAEASRFDTVINVAKEIKNPFKQKQGEGTVMSFWRNDTRPRSIAEPQTAISEYSFKSAWEFPQENIITPTATTPTQSLFKPKEPEYLHVKWDHNSEILDDLYPLCKIIDDRVAQGKKVLIHCQLGVSRSASLIIAYGLFKNYQNDFHSMYTSVKERSRWVGPNMSLIYQLTDFKNKLNRGSVVPKDANPEWFVPTPEGPLTPTAPTPSKSHPTENEEKTTQDTPLRLNKALPPVPIFPKTEKSSSPSSQIPAPTMAPPLPTIQSRTNTVKRAASKPLPFRERFAQMSIPAHKPRPVPNLSTNRPPSAVMDLAMNDVPSTPSIFSPRVTEFTATPFDIRGAGDLSTPGNRQSKEIPVNFSWLPLRKDGHQRTASKDPRSPHQIVESQDIYRNIDNYL